MMSSDPLSFMDISLDDDPPRVPPAASNSSNTGVVTPTAGATTSSFPVAPFSTTSTTSNRGANSNAPRFLRWMIQFGLLDASPSSWETSFLEMQATFEQHVKEHPFPVEEEGEAAALAEDANLALAAATDSSSNANSSKNVSSSSPLDLDPLTAMVQATESEAKRLAEMDLQYRKEKALRNRGKAAARLLPESEEYDEEYATLQVIDKDLNRLANPHNNNNDMTEMSKEEEDARKEMLRQILFCYHCLNSDPGYRQGMHETASFLLYALEVDNNSGGGTVKPIYYAPLTFNLLTHVLRGMAPAFDVQKGVSAGTGSALQQIGRRVDYIVRTHDPLLGNKLAKLQVPGQMYFTKWIRLLFAREVNDVLDFWDGAFFSTQIDTTNHNIMALLEAWTAARLLVWSAHFMSIRDEGQLLQTLMNLPVEPETAIWSDVARTLVQKGRTVVIPPANQQFRPPVPASPEPAAAPSAVTSHLPNFPSITTNKSSIAPFKKFLGEAGTGKHLGGWMEQISSKTQVLGQRVKQEWEHIAAATTPEPTHIFQQQGAHHQAPKPGEDGMGYNIEYRGAAREPPLYDPPVPSPVAPQPPAPSPRPLTRGVICKRLDHSTATLHTFLVEQQQQRSVQVPESVWHALADLQKLSKELRPRANQS